MCRDKALVVLDSAVDSEMQTVRPTQDGGPLTMTQLDLLASLTRWTIPAGSWSWRDGERSVRVVIGAHCVDLAWPWWTPREVTT